MRGDRDTAGFTFTWSIRGTPRGAVLLGTCSLYQDRRHRNCIYNALLPFKLSGPTVRLSPNLKHNLTTLTSSKALYVFTRFLTFNIQTLIVPHKPQRDWSVLSSGRSLRWTGSLDWPTSHSKRRFPLAVLHTVVKK